MTPKLRALLHYIAPRVPTATHMRIIAAHSDFEAYAVHGWPLTHEGPKPGPYPKLGEGAGCGWRKGYEFAYPDGMTEASWMRATRRIFRAHQPLHLVLAGDLIAALVLFKAVRR